MRIRVEKLRTWTGEGSIAIESPLTATPEVAQQTREALGAAASLPVIALTVADHPALLLLTAADVQLGEHVTVTTDTDGFKHTYQVVDEAALSADGITPGTDAAFGVLMLATPADVGLGNVDNTADVDKPVSDAAQMALDLKAPLASPALTGIPTAPTAAPGTDTDQIATMAAVKATIDALLAGAPGALDTLNELAAALGDDEDFAATVTASLAAKANAATVNQPTISVADATERKTLATYTALSVTPYIGMRVSQADLPGTDFLFAGTDVTLDADWIGLAVADETGAPVTLGHSVPSGGFGRLAATMSGAALANPCVLIVGDSIAEGVQYELETALTERFGGLQSKGPQVGPERTLSAGATLVEDGYDIWPNGEYSSVPAGEDVYFSKAGSGTQSSAAKLYYVAEPGAGTFKVQVSHNGGAYADVVASVDADESLAIKVVSVPMQHGINLVKAVTLTGTVKIVQARYYTQGIPGVRVAAIQEGGINLASMSLTPAAVMAAAMQDIAPDVVILLANESYDWITNDLPTFYAAVNTALGYTPDWILCGRGTVRNESNTTERQAMARFARLNGQIYTDLNTLLEPNLLAVDDTHPSAEGYRAIANHLVNHVEPLSSVPVKFRQVESDSGLLTRRNLGYAMLKSASRIKHLTPYGFANSGTASAAAFVQGGAELKSGGDAGGYGLCVLDDNTTSYAPTTGTGFNFSIPFRLAVSCTGTSANAGGKRRVIVGANSAATPAAGDADAIADKGCGFEISLDGSVGSVRLFTHDGTTYRTSDWVPIRTNSALASTISTILIASDGAGLFALEAMEGTAFSAPPVTPKVSLTGPTGALSSSSLAEVIAVAVANTTSPTSQTLLVRNSVMEMVR